MLSAIAHSQDTQGSQNRSLGTQWRLLGINVQCLEENVIMKTTTSLLVLTLLISQSVLATNMYYPGNTEGQTMAGQATTPPQYYPPANPNPVYPNKNIPDKYKENTNVQGKTQMPVPSPTSN